MPPAERLAQLAGALEELHIPFLVMGGHALRFYGVDRNTFDFDLHLAFDDFSHLGDALSRARLFAELPLVEGPSWRPACFRRFIIGRLADGREERVEFWRQNHLLAPFPVLWARRETGPYGGRDLPFLSLPDLIHSKETERESDWQDVALLEEMLDLRRLGQRRDEGCLVLALAQLRSRRGYEQAAARGCFGNAAMLAEALRQAVTPMSQAYLIPWLPPPSPAPIAPGLMGEILCGPLRAVPPGSARHLALVEAVRRLYKQAAMETDRADKRQAAQGAGCASR